MKRKNTLFIAAALTLATIAASSAHANEMQSMSQGSGQQMNAPAPKAKSSSELGYFLRSDLSGDERAAFTQLMADHGKAVTAVLNDQSLSTDEKLAKIASYWKDTIAKLAATYVDPAKLDDFNTYSEKKIQETLDGMKRFLNDPKHSPGSLQQSSAGQSGQANPGRGDAWKTGAPGNSQNAQGKKEGWDKNRNNDAVTGSENRPQPPRGSVLSDATKKKLEQQLRAIPDDKKAAFYDRAKTVLTDMLQKAKAAGKTKLAAQVGAVMDAVENILGQGSQDESNILNSIFSTDTGSSSASSTSAQ